jgi:hypothetical protein
MPSTTPPQAQLATVPFPPGGDSHALAMVLNFKKEKNNNNNLCKKKDVT